MVSGRRRFDALPDDGYTESKINSRSWSPGLRTKSSGHSNPDSPSGRVTRHQVIAYLICTQKVLPDSNGSREKEGRRQLAESEPSRQSRRVANLGVEPHRSLEEVERDARKANAEPHKAAKEAKEVSAQEGVPSGSAVQDAHQVSKSSGQETDPGGAGVSMSADSKLGPDDEDKSVPDASAQASVGGADVVEPPVEYVETKKPQFGLADDVEVVEVGSDPDDDDDEVELMKVEPAVRKEAHLSTVQEDQVLEDMKLSSLKSSGTASIRTPVQARFSPVLSVEVQVKAFVADQVCRCERSVSESSFPPNIKYDWSHDHLDSSSYLSAILTTSEYLRKQTLGSPSWS
ncbi:unnamed protein product [Phytophthora fragariaefolia]|uniref:Unnamed protein product n=1 Tax=Phytophthora fragariaefolia TaxID=1490495 RepID=A0A9W6XEF0_9STRA|nr:unnamed protein product [Phytophthora fragariaefolia]